MRYPVMARLLLAGLVLRAVAALAAPRHPDLPDPGFHFRSFYVTWGGTTNAVFHQFLKEVRPEIVQCGFYGPMFHGYADDPKSTGYPMQLPVPGQREALAVQREVNRQVRRLGCQVVGHFQMVNVIADPGKTNGFFAFYEKGWPTDLLGPRPHADVRELLMRDAAGNVLSNSHYVTYAGLCWNSPHARSMLKAMLKLALDQGLDGVIVNYNYRWDCACPWCQDGFRRWLGRKYEPATLRSAFAITNLASHRFAAIGGRIPGYAASNAPPLEREAAFWAAEAYKRAFDEIFIEYGRSLKKDLIVATWDHLGDLAVTEERAYLPLDQWGRGEHYFWYSGGYGPTKLAERKLGDGWVNGLFLLEMGGGKPFMLGKYEPVRMRNSIAEALATGGSGMGLYMTIGTPEGYRSLADYVGFPRNHPDLYEEAEPAADIALLWPRTDVQNGNKEAAEEVRDLGRYLSERQAPFELVVDARARDERLARYKAVLVPRSARPDPDLQAALVRFEGKGGWVARVTMADTGTVDRVKALSDWRVDGPWTVKAMTWQGKGRRLLHLVNYDRDEGAPGEKPPKAEPESEHPIPTPAIPCRLQLPPRVRVSSVRCFQPESPRGVNVPFRVEDGVLRFEGPPVAVYGVVEVRGRGL